MKRIPDHVLTVIDELSPDLVTLNEYVDGDERTPFKKGLREIGFPHISVSQKYKRQNQVLIASKTEHKRGDLRPPLYDEAAISNFLHVIVPTFAIEVVGLRAPAYKRTQDQKIYWSDLLAIFKSVAARRIVFVGDFNCNPVNSNTPGARSLNQLCKEGWELPIPSGPWSYISCNGRKRSALDYALCSPAVENLSGTYISAVGSCLVAGTKEQNPISDHAVLMSEIGTNRCYNRNCSLPSAC